MSFSTTRRFIGFLLLLLAFGSVSSGQSGPGGPGGIQTGTSPLEVIVLLAPDAHGLSTEAWVSTLSSGYSQVLGAMASNPPISARLALTHRMTGIQRDRMLSDPGSARARLERYVVLAYPSNTDFSALKTQLEADPDIENVERNDTMSFDVAPDDPLLPVTSDPTEHQWGAHSLNLPAAWERSRGHAYLGIIDTGLDTDHPDLRPFPNYQVTGGECSFANGPYEGGNFRPHLSYDFGDGDCDVTETYVFQGHGTHVSGIAAATTDNSIGVAGHCWFCPIMMAKALAGNGELAFDTIADSMTFLVDRGAQNVSLSLGAPGRECPSSMPNVDMVCTALEHAEDHDVVLLASSGNNKRDINFPANSPLVMAIGGTQPTGAFWDEETIDTFECPCDRDAITSGCSVAPTQECGSNFQQDPGDPAQDLVVPARTVVSTFVPGAAWNAALGCDDAALPPNGDGYGSCTGTSMSAPAASALAGLVRSVNPLLDRSEVYEALTSTASHSGSNDPQLGFGIPDAEAAVAKALGSVDGETIDNRLTPLFMIDSEQARSHLFATAPQQIQAAFFDAEVSDFQSSGSSTLSFYPSFPTIPECTFGPCPFQIPTASVAVLTTHVNPTSSSAPLNPLYRMSFDEEFAGNPTNRSFVYVITDSEIETFKNVGYRLDGLEGYLLPRCTPEPSCMPAFTTKIHRLYNSVRDDYVIVPASQVASFQAQGYAPLTGVVEVLGYAYGIEDTDGDDLLDGFESLIGTDPFVADSDCDGLNDGVELPPAGLPVGDPLDGACSTDVAVSLNASITPGGSLNWITTVTASNLGTGQAEQVTVDLIFSPGSTGWDWFPPVFGCFQVGLTRGLAEQFRCPLGNLAPGATVSRTFGVDVPMDGTTLNISGSVATVTPDTNSANDTAQTSIDNGGLP